MPTQQSRQDLEYLLNTFGADLCTQIGRTIEAGYLSGVTINNSSQLSSALVQLQTYEAQVRSSLIPAQSAYWQTSSNWVADQVFANTDLVQMLQDPDDDVKRLLKTGLRTLSFMRMQFDWQQDQ